MANLSVSLVFLSGNILVHSMFNIKWHFLCFIPLSIKFIYFKCLSLFNKSVKMFVFEFCGNYQVCLLLFCKLILMITNCFIFQYSREYKLRMNLILIYTHSQNVTQIWPDCLWILINNEKQIFISLGFLFPFI